MYRYFVLFCLFNINCIPTSIFTSKMNYIGSESLRKAEVDNTKIKTALICNKSAKAAAEAVIREANIFGFISTKRTNELLIIVNQDCK